MKKLYFGTCLFALFLSHEVSAADVYVRQIAVKGLERVEPETVASYLDIKKGQNVSQEKLDSSLKQLYATGLFNDVVFNISPDGTLMIRVMENPIVNKRVFDGNDKVDDSLLESEVQLAAGSIYNRAKVQEDVQRILEVYKRSCLLYTSDAADE